MLPSAWPLGTWAWGPNRPQRQERLLAALFRDVPLSRCLQQSPDDSSCDWPGKTRGLGQPKREGPKKKKKEGGRTADSYSRARIQGLTALPTFVDGSRRWVVTRRARSQEAEHRQGPPFKSVFVGLKMKTWATQEGKAEPGMWPGHRLGSPPSPGKPREGPPSYTAPGTCAGPKARRRWKVLGHPHQTLPLQTQKPRLTQGPGLAQGPWEEPRAGIPYSRTFPSNTRLPGKATLVLHQKTDSQRTGI